MLQQNMDLRKDEQLSSIPWLNKKLLSIELAPYLRKMLSQAELNWSPGRLLIMTAACFALPSYFCSCHSSRIRWRWWSAWCVGLLPFGWVLFKRSRRFAAFEKDLPEALDLMVSGLRAGHSLLAAMALVSRECPEPVKGEFKICFEEQNYGLEMKTALENLLDRVPLQDLRIAATAIMIQKESGGNLAEVLDKTSHVIRERFRLKRQIMVHTAQGRLTGLDSYLPAHRAGHRHLFRGSGHDQHFVASPNRHQAAVGRGRNDYARRVCDLQDRQHRRIGERYGIRNFRIRGCISADRQRRASAVLSRSHATAHQRSDQSAPQGEKHRVGGAAGQVLDRQPDGVRREPDAEEREGSFDRGAAADARGVPQRVGGEGFLRLQSGGADSAVSPRAGDRLGKPWARFLCT